MMNTLKISRGKLKSKIDIMESNMQTTRKTVDALLQQNFSESEFFKIACSYLLLEQIGGDFYYVISNESGIHLFLCDMSGHGIASTLLLALLKYFSENILNYYGVNLGRYREELNSISLNKNFSLNYLLQLPDFFPLKMV